MLPDKANAHPVVLQGIGRVNRSYEGEKGQVKPYGFVLDFVGIFEKLEKALAFDPDEVASAIQNIDVLKQLFSQLMQKAVADYLSWTQGKDDKAKERIIEHFLGETQRNEFFTAFRRIENL